MFFVLFLGHPVINAVNIVGEVVNNKTASLLYLHLNYLPFYRVMVEVLGTNLMLTDVRGGLI